MTAVLAVALGGLVGAPLRYHLDRLVQSRHGSAFPWGTLAVNVLGCFVLGLLMAAVGNRSLDPTTFALLGTGLCGAFTTYSTFGYETVRLVEDGVRWTALASVVASLSAGLGAALAGSALGAILWSG